MKYLLFALCCVAPLFGAVDVTHEVTVTHSPLWREADANTRAQVEKTQGAARLLDLAFPIEGGMVSLQQFVLDDGHPREAFDVFVAGTLAGAKKPGFHVIAEGTVPAALFPATGVLLERMSGDTIVRALVLKAFTDRAGYLFMFIGDRKLGFDSDLVRRYSERIAFAEGSHLSTVGPKSSIEKAWDEGSQNGMMLIGIFLVLAALGVYWLVRRRISREKDAA